MLAGFENDFYCDKNMPEGTFRYVRISGIIHGIKIDASELETLKPMHFSPAVDLPLRCNKVLTVVSTS